SGRFASRLAGLLAGSRRIPMTILRTDAEGGDGSLRSARAAAEAEPVEALAKEMAGAAEPDTADAGTTLPPIDITTRPPDKPIEEAVAAEARKGYDFMVVGIEPIGEEGVFDDKLARIAAEVALSLARADHGTVTALYVAPASARQWHRRFGPGWAASADEAAILRE